MSLSDHINFALIQYRQGNHVPKLVNEEVKRFYKENGYYRLQPENDTMDPIIVDHVDILGKVIGLYRRI